MRGCEGELETAPPQRAPAVSGALASPLPPCSAPPTLLPSSSSQLPRPSVLAASPVRIYCECELLRRSHTPTEGSNLQAAVVSVA